MTDFDLDLTNPANASQLTCTRASVGYHDSLTGVWTSFAVNTPRLTNRGLRVEEARTNSIRNNSMQGATISPSTLPTHWDLSFLTFAGKGVVTRLGPAGLPDAKLYYPGQLNVQVVGTGTENGVEYIDLRFTGNTASAFELNFEGGNVIAAINGQVWAASAFCKLVAGDTSPFGWFYLGWSRNDASGNYIADVGETAALPRSVGPLTRLTSVGTIAGTTSFVQPYIYCECGSGPFDFTMRIGWPQMELAGTTYTVYAVTSPIRTTSAAATRATEDVTVNTFATWYASGPGTIAFDGRSDQYATVGAGAVGNIAGGGGGAEFIYDSGGIDFIFWPSTEGYISPSLGPRYRIAAAWDTNDIQVYANQQPAIHRTGYTPPVLTAMHLGTTDIGYIGSDGPLTRFKYWPRRLTDDELWGETYVSPSFDIYLAAAKYTDPDDFIPPTIGVAVTTTRYINTSTFHAHKIGIVLTAGISYVDIDQFHPPVISTTGGNLTVTLFESATASFGVPELAVLSPPVLPPSFETEGPTLPDVPVELPDIASAAYEADPTHTRITYVDGSQTVCITGGDTAVCMQLEEWIALGNTVGPYVKVISSQDVNLERDRRIGKGILVTLASGRMIALQTRSYPDFINVSLLTTTALSYPTPGMRSVLKGGPSPFGGIDSPSTRTGQGDGQMVIRDAYNRDQILTADEMIEIGARLTGTVQTYYNAAWQLKDTTTIPLDYTDDKYWPDYSFPPSPPSGYGGGLQDIALIDAWLWVGADGLLWADAATVIGVETP